MSTSAVDWHDFVASTDTYIDNAGRRRVRCARCGAPSNAWRHRGEAATLASARKAAATTAARGSHPTGPRATWRRVRPAVDVDVAAAIPPPPIEPRVVVRQVIVEAPPEPDWRLFAAWHAVVMAEEVKDLDAGLEHALKVAARELDYVLHRRPRANGGPVALPTPSYARPEVGQVETVTRLPRIRDNDLRNIVRLAVEQGFSWKVQGSGHLRATGPDGRGFTVSTTAVGSDARTLKNVRAEARRAGVNL